MTFRLASTLTAIVCFILFALFLIVPGTYTATYGVEAGTGGVFFGRRLSPMVLGLALMLWMLRGTRDLAVQRAVAVTMIVIFAGVAATGVFEFVTGFASTAILVAALGELIIAGVFARTLRQT